MVEDGFIILGAKSCPTQGNNRRGIQCPPMHIFDPPVKTNEYFKKKVSIQRML